MALWRPSGQLTVYPWGERVATPTPYVRAGRDRHRGGRFVIDVTAVADTPSVVPTIDGYDPVSGQWYNLLTAAALTAAGTTVLNIYPGITAATNLSAAAVLPPTWRVVMTHDDADAIAYSVSALLIP